MSIIRQTDLLQTHPQGSLSFLQIGQRDEFMVINKECCLKMTGRLVRVLSKASGKKDYLICWERGKQRKQVQYWVDTHNAPSDIKIPFDCVGKSTENTAFSPGQGEFPDYQEFHFIWCISYVLVLTMCCRPNQIIELGSKNKKWTIIWTIYQNTPLQ